MLISPVSSRKHSQPLPKPSGDVFAADAGDIDIRDSIHSDRILIVMIPALDTSAHTTSALGRMFITQQSMILARDLGYRTGKAQTHRPRK